MRTRRGTRAGLLVLPLMVIGCGGHDATAPPTTEEPSIAIQVEPLDEGDPGAAADGPVPEGDLGAETVVLDGCAKEDGILSGTLCCISPAYALKPWAPEHVITTQDGYREMIAAVEGLLSEKENVFEGEDREEGACEYPEIDFGENSLLMMVASDQPFCQRHGVTTTVVAEPQEKKYVFTVTVHGTGYCKKKHRAWWVMVLVPRLPVGWDVEFVRETVHLDASEGA